MNGARLYFFYLSISLRAQLQYRTSFLLQTLAHFAITFAEFLAVAALFKRFGNLSGWTLPQVALLYGMISMSMALAEAIPRGFDIFPRYLKSGDFDRMLLRPRTTVLQMIGSEFQLFRVGRLLQGLGVLVWAVAQMPPCQTVGALFLMVAAVMGGACFFSGLFILSAVLCFWTMESIEIVNTVTYGGVEAGQFPLSIYKPWFRRFFTFVIPLATVAYFPAQMILGLAPLGSWRGLFYVLSPLVGVAFLGISLMAWRYGLKKYTSSGS